MQLMQFTNMTNENSMNIVMSGFITEIYAAEEDKSRRAGNHAERMRGASGAGDLRLPVLRDPLYRPSIVSAETCRLDHKMPHSTATASQACANSADDTDKRHCPPDSMDQSLNPGTATRDAR